MKFFLLSFFCFLFSLSLLAATYESKIYSIERGKKNEDHLIFLMDGHVAFLANDSESILSELQESLNKNEWIESTLDSELNLVSFRVVENSRIQTRSSAFQKSLPLFSYEPTIITLTQARSAFRNMRRDYQDDSQCYNRAHIWTYEEFNRNSILSNKLFLFFTSKYIRAYRYHWWFHVTPMVYVGGTSQDSWRTLDRRYTASPLTTKTWTNLFMSNDALCPVVEKYSDYREHQSEKWCYLLPTSMYYWQPRDIERFERTSYEKTSYITSEVDYAYWEAF